MVYFKNTKIWNAEKKRPIKYSLIIEATASAGGVAKLGEGASDLVVQLVSQSSWDTFPGQDDDDDDRIGTVVAGAMTHQT